MFKNTYTTCMKGNGKALAKRFEHISGKNVRCKRTITVMCLAAIVSVVLLGTIVMAEVTGNNASYELSITNNAVPIDLENKPFVEDGEVYVPLRELFTKLGFMEHKDAKMEWQDGVVLINLVEKNLNNDAASDFTSYMYKIEIGKNELIINPDELVNIGKTYEFVEPMNLAPVLKVNTTYVPFAYAVRMIERADNGTQSPPDRYKIDFTYSGEILTIGYPFDEEYKITSMFGERIHPITGEKALHDGVDISVDTGTAVKAGIDGMVVDEGFNEDRGYYVIIKNEIGVEILYAHLNTIDRHGSYEVKKGDIIGTSGSSGKSTGPHLHMSVRVNERYVNPQLYFEE